MKNEINLFHSLLMVAVMLISCMFFKDVKGREEYGIGLNLKEKQFGFWAKGRIKKLSKGGRSK